MPRNPSSPIRRSTSRGTKPCSSHLAPCGLISVSTKRRSCARNASCSSRKYGEGRALVSRRFIFDLAVGQRAASRHRYPSPEGGGWLARAKAKRETGGVVLAGGLHPTRRAS